MCSKCGGVWILLFEQAAGSKPLNEVSHNLLYTAKLIRPWGEAVEGGLLITADQGFGPPWQTTEAI